MRKFFLMLSLAFFAMGASPDAKAVETLLELRTKTATFSLDDRGAFTGIVRNDSPRNYLAAGQPAPLLSVRIGGKWYAPENAVWDARKKRLTLRYPPAGTSSVLLATIKRTHIVFEIAEIHSPLPIELVVWGPYPTTIDAIIGETVGVVRDDEFAVGIQALNAKTLGGFPTAENDIEAESSGNDLGHYPNLEPELLKDQHYRGDTAQRTAFGSVLQAFCRNRDTERIVPNWGHEKYLVKPFADGGPVGSKIALFACPANDALKTIGAIEIAENLPHPTLNGVWAKATPDATASYLIVDFSEENVDRAIEMTRRAGLKYLYHSSPFETWGHFQLKPSLFPHGWNGLRVCVEKARKAGIGVGFHTLSNFITPNDPYVTPKPDPRLARIGNSELAVPITSSQKEIPVAAPDYFVKKTAMNTVVIGEELVRYGAVSKEAPYRLLECERGAWGTAAAAHPVGATVGKLLDHEYNVFLSDADLSQEIARNIASLFHQTGTLQLSFDGLEGNWSTGYGQYGRTLFTQTWFDSLSPELKGRVINDASNPGHFNWHINTRMNWGEPWYAGFRESQTLYRFKNQVYFERNFFPHMLGWFALRPDTSVEDAEWLLARAAGFDAGFTLATSLASTAQLAADPASAEAAKIFGSTGEILEAVREWETARMSGAFSPTLKAELRDNHREFHLQSVGKGKWDIREAHYARFVYEGEKNAPGAFEISSSDAPQPLQWTIRSASEEAVPGLTVEVNGALIADMKEQALPPGGHLRYRGGTEAVISDASWREIARIPVRPTATMPTGSQKLRIHATSAFRGSLKIECRTLSPATRISGKAMHRKG